MWLLGRLQTARRAVEVLERKERALRQDHERLSELARQTERRWTADVEAAEQRLGAAAILGGLDQLDRAAASAPACDVVLRTAFVMGVAYPGQVRCVPGEPGELVGSAALPAAVAAYRTALETGVNHATATAARDRVGEALATTIQRLRAIRDRWIPALEAHLAEAEIRFDEADRETMARAMRALEHLEGLYPQPSARQPPP